MNPTSRPRVLDAFCCQGGAATGYHQAGFDVIGVDLAPQPRYPFEFIQGDAVQFIAEHGHKFDLIHASPPCQAFTEAQKLRGNDHPDLIGPTREAMQAAGRPFVIENVEGARALLAPDAVLLCGAMFGLRTYRHRLFETSWPAAQRHHPRHIAPLAKMGRPPRPGEFMHVVGNFSGVDLAREVMGMPWADRDGLREAIPPAYTRHVADQFLAWRDATADEAAA